MFSLRYINAARNAFAGQILSRKYLSHYSRLYTDIYVHNTIADKLEKNTEDRGWRTAKDRKKKKEKKKLVPTHV